MPSSGPLTSGPVDHSIVSCLNTVSSMQTSSVERQSSTSLSTPSRPVEQREVSSNLGVSTLGAFNATQTPSAPLSLSSPCSAETMGAGGEAPVIMISQRRPSSRSPKSASPSQPQLPLTDGFGMRVQQMGNPESLMPPSMRRARSDGFAPQGLQQSLTLQHQQPQQQQPGQCSAQQFHMTVRRAEPQFVTNNLAGNYFFSEGHHDQGNQNWGDVQISQMGFNQSLNCRICSNTGFLVQNGEMIRCHCEIFPGLQT
jgi:hypothetical protein